MKVFCAYAFTGEQLGEVTARMRLVVDTLQQDGHEVYCNLFDEACQTLVGPKAFVLHALEVLKKHDVVVAIMTSDRRSEGQLIEVGAALTLDKPIYVLQHRSAAGKSYLPELAQQAFEWETPDELAVVLRELGKVING